MTARAVIKNFDFGPGMVGFGVSSLLKNAISRSSRGNEAQMSSEIEAI